MSEARIREVAQAEARAGQYQYERAEKAEAEAEALREERDDYRRRYIESESRAASRLARAEALREALRKVEYVASVSYESAGEMARAVDRIVDITRAALSEHGLSDPPTNERGAALLRIQRKWKELNEGIDR